MSFGILYNRSKLTLYTFLWLEYAILALLGYYTVNVGIYSITNVNPYNLDILPYLFCFAFMWIIFYPFKNITLTNIPIPQSKNIRLLIKIWAVVTAAFLALKVSEASITVSTGLAEAYENRHVLGESLFDYSGYPILRRINFFGNLFISTTNPFVVFYCVQNLNTKQEKTSFLYFLLVIAFLPSIVAGIGTASRGSIFNGFVKILFYALIFRDYVPEKTKKIAVTSFAVLLGIMAFYSLAITVARLSGKGVDEFDSIFRYFGECFPNLGAIFWDNVNTHPMGERLFPEFTGVDFSSNWDSADERFLFWSNITGVPMLLFKTIFGDLYIEFGIIGAFIFAAVMTSVMKYIAKKGLTYYNISYLAYYFQICVMGFAAFTGFGGFNNTIIVFMIIVNITLYFYSKKHKTSQEV